MSKQKITSFEDKVETLQRRRNIYLVEREHMGNFLRTVRGKLTEMGKRAKWLEDKIDKIEDEIFNTLESIKQCEVEDGTD